MFPIPTSGPNMGEWGNRVGTYSPFGTPSAPHSTMSFNGAFPLSAGSMEQREGVTNQHVGVQITHALSVVHDGRYSQRNFQPSEPLFAIRFPSLQSIPGNKVYTLKEINDALRKQWVDYINIFRSPIGSAKRKHENENFLDTVITEDNFNDRVTYIGLAAITELPGKQEMEGPVDEKVRLKVAHVEGRIDCAPIWAGHYSPGDYVGFAVKRMNQANIYSVLKQFTGANIGGGAGGTNTFEEDVIIARAYKIYKSDYYDNSKPELPITTINEVEAITGLYSTTISAILMDIMEAIGPLQILPILAKKRHCYLTYTYHHIEDLTTAYKYLCPSALTDKNIAALDAGDPVSKANFLEKSNELRYKMCADYKYSTSAGMRGLTYVTLNHSDFIKKRLNRATDRLPQLMLYPIFKTAFVINVGRIMEVFTAPPDPAVVARAISSAGNQNSQEVMTWADIKTTSDSQINVEHARLQGSYGMHLSVSITPSTYTLERDMKNIERFGKSFY